MITTFSASFLSAFLLAFTAVAVGWVFRKKRNQLPYPPGPRRDPFIGHLRSMPLLEEQADVFHEWAKTYGDVIFLEVLGKKLLILDSVEAVNDLLEKRSPNYSNRPTFPMFALMGLNKTLVFLQFGKEFILQRKLSQTYFGAKESRDLIPIQYQEAHIMVKKLIADPKDYVDILETFSTGMITRIAYGYDLTGMPDDPLMKIIQEVVQASRYCPNMTALDVLPWLAHLPKWFPGAYWAEYARRNRHFAENFYNYPFDMVQKQVREGTVKASFTSTHLSHVDPDMPEREGYMEAIKLTAAQIFSAGSETTAGMLLVFLIAMVLYPEAQAKAQADIDRVIGTDRLPTPDDRPDLPCVDNIVHEIARWNPILPLGIPHVSLEDDIFRGMLIPKDTMVFANSRSMGLNERVYKDPKSFNPDRYIPKDEGGLGEPVLSPFGFGRRICPGRFMADNSLWISAALILATCKLGKARDADGLDITPKVEFTTGIAKQLKPFPFALAPRTDNSVMLLEQYQSH
ncbi:cytochrome P450 [Hymenopellis radicata]|nr:cytochrome P450 [Hymenopellis radicata]